MEKTKKTKATERTYWCVISEYHVGGEIKAWIFTRNRKERPEDACYRYVPHIDTWVDWFTSEAKARACLDEAPRAPELYEEFLSRREKALA
jgi:hypothetical protein